MRIKLFNIFRVFFYLALISSFFITIMVTVATFIELLNYEFSLSMQAIETFLNSFVWCEKYYIAFLSLYTIFFSLKKYESDVASRIFANHLEPSIKRMYDRLSLIQSENLEMYNYFLLNGEQIIHDIISSDKSVPYITNKKELSFYFYRYVNRDVIFKFESCAFYHNSNMEPARYKKGEEPFSINTFLKIAYQLFCISSKYKKYDKDIMQLYRNSIPDLN